MSDQITITFPRPESGDYASLPGAIILDDLEVGPILPILGLVVSRAPVLAVDAPGNEESGAFKWNEDHDCSREGIESPFPGGNWNSVENDHAAYRLAQNAGYRILTPLVMAQMWMFNRTYTLAKKYMTKEQALEFYHYWLHASNLQGDIEQRLCEISALIVQNIPVKLTSLNDMLESAMAESGFCCYANVAAYLSGHMPAHRIKEMEDHTPDFKREWLTPGEPNAPLETN